MSLIECPACKKEVSINAPSCPNCGEPINTNVKCPKCNSYNTKTISSASKTASIILWGMFAASKVMSKYQCKDCGNKF